jgi:hypothetical protein
MIPAIGAMIGIYIITRMLEMLSKQRPMPVKVFGVITILVTLVAVVDIFNAGSRVANSFGM